MLRSSVASVTGPSLSLVDVLLFVATVGLFLLFPILVRGLPSGSLASERIRRKHGVGFVGTAVGSVAAGVGVWIPVVVGDIPESDVVLFSGLLLFVLGVVALTYAACNVTTFLRALRTPITDVIDTDPGRVELMGRVRPLETMHAPLSGEPAVCYRLVVDEWLVDSGSDTVHIETDRQPFVLEDGTGRVLVDPNGADLRFQTETEIETEPDETTPEPVSRALRKVPDLEATENKREYAEAKLEPGEEVSVLGRARRDPEGPGSLTIDGDGREFVIQPAETGSITAEFRSIVIEATLGGLVFVVVGQVLLLGLV